MSQALHNAVGTNALPDRDRHAFRRLHALGRLGLCGDVCLATTRAGLAGCRRCVDACPHTSLSQGDGIVELDPVACTGCGICAARCPTGALTAEGFTLPTSVPMQGITLACERACAAPHGALHRVPCLGGLALNDWLRLVLTAGKAPVRVLDDGHCVECDRATGAAAPWLDTLASVQRALAYAGAAADGLPQRVTPPPLPLPNGNTRPQTTADAAVGSRRGFLAGLSRSVVSTIAQAASGDAMSTVSAPRPAHRRDAITDGRGEETRLLLRLVARRHGRPHPQHAELPGLSVNDACRAHGTCARVCPTGALQLDGSADGRLARLRFDAWLCVDCGACAAMCPSRALSHQARAPRPFVDGPVELAAIGQCECTRCGALFAASEDEMLCARCRKTDALARAGLALFHRPREIPAAPEGP